MRSLESPCIFCGHCTASIQPGLPVITCNQIEWTVLSFLVQMSLNDQPCLYNVDSSALVQAKNISRQTTVLVLCSLPVGKVCYDLL